MRWRRVVPADSHSHDEAHIGKYIMSIHVPEECSESKERIATRDAHCSRSRVHQVASKVSGNHRTAPQRFNGFAPNLEWGLGLTLLQSPLLQQHACHAMLRRSASLRGAFVAILAKTNTPTGQCFSAAASATRLRSATERVQSHHR